MKYNELLKDFVKAVHIKYECDSTDIKKEVSKILVRHFRRDFLKLYKFKVDYTDLELSISIYDKGDTNYNEIDMEDFIERYRDYKHIQLVKALKDNH